jgi:DNA-binding transcriptional LysR family regulator
VSRESLEPGPFGGSMNPSIELRHLRYYLAVVEELHFGRAAGRLHISQPPLSQAIRKLEDELGAQLLRRNSRSVVPTAAGLVFAEEARRVLGALDAAVAEARRATGARSVLRIGALPTIALHRLQHFLTALASREPSLHPQVTHIGSLEQIRRLRSGELDFGVLHLPVQNDGIHAEPLFAADRAVALLPHGHRLASKRVIAPKDVTGETLVMFPRSLHPMLYDSWLAAIEGAGYRFPELHDVKGTDPRDLVLAIAEGSGIGVGSTSYAAASEAGAVVTPRFLPKKLVPPPIVVAWRLGGPRNAGGLVDLVRGAAGDARTRP